MRYLVQNGLILLVKPRNPLLNHLSNGFEILLVKWVHFVLDTSQIHDFFMENLKLKYFGTAWSPTCQILWIRIDYCKRKNLSVWTDSASDVLICEPLTLALAVHLLYIPQLAVTMYWCEGAGPRSSCIKIYSIKIKNFGYFEFLLISTFTFILRILAIESRHFRSTWDL